MTYTSSRRNIILAVSALLVFLIAVAFLWPYRDFFNPRMTELRHDFGIIALRPCTAPCDTPIAIVEDYQLKTLRLDGLIARAGTPDKVAAVFTGNAEEFRVLYLFYYVRRGLSFSATRVYRPPGSPVTALKPDLDVEWVNVWTARTEDEFFSEITERLFRYSAYGIQKAQPWSGYRAIDLIMPQY
ncbi:MAG: hypothetical protein HZB53_22415 [Chloroflexi bacterium]|nr:hypothetical protein [Chloroflexota bacterium]